MTVTLSTAAVSRLEAPSPAQRRSFDGLSPADNAELCRTLPALTQIEAGGVPASAEAPGPVKAVAWNLERGRHPAETAARLAETGADIVLLSEMDAGMARTDQRHTAADLAERLGMTWVFGVEFVELGLGNSAERADLAPDAENDRGLHGNAILSRHALARPALARLDDGGRWLEAPNGEKRVGGRMALFAKLRLGGREAVAAVTHLESHGDPKIRGEEMRRLVEALDGYAGPEVPVVLGGDFNTTSMARADWEDGAARARRMREDPDRCLWPEGHEPLFAHAEDAGFVWDRADMRDGTKHSKPGEDLPPARLDWIFLRGLVPETPETLCARRGDGFLLSDHDAVAVTARPSS